MNIAVPSLLLKNILPRKKNHARPEEDQDSAGLSSICVGVSKSKGGGAGCILKKGHLGVVCEFDKGLPGS